jgi:1-acyl-sn-glycerol-3-phosphate acyltransferase
MIKIHTVAPIMTQAVIYTTTYLLFKPFAKFTVTGLENIKNHHGALIFAPNHSSEWDGILVRVALPFWSKEWSPMYYVSMVKEKYTDSGWRKFIYGGTLFNLLGAYPVYSGKKDYAYSLQNHVQILQNGSKLCLFPEGQRTKDGALGKAHGGVAFLSHTMQVPVVPVAISGLVRFSVREFFSFKRTVSLHFGEIMLPQQVVSNPTPAVEDFQKGATIIMSRVGELLAKSK